MRYNVAFEGGGGKGAAYLVAAAYLQQPQVRAQLNGFSGSSAGALTALAIAIGIPWQELAVFTRYGGFNRTLPVTREETVSKRETGPVIRAVVEFGLGQVHSGIIELPDAYRRLFDKNKQKYKQVDFGIKAADEVIAGILLTHPVVPLHVLGGYILRTQPIQGLRDKLLNEVGSMKDHLNPETYANLLTTGGMFTGNMLVEALRDGLLNYATTANLPMIGKWARLYDDMEHLLELSITANKVGVNNAYPTPSTANTNPYSKAAAALTKHGTHLSGQDDTGERLTVRFKNSYMDPLTFEELYEFTRGYQKDGKGMDLVVTGSNLLNGKTYYFSRHTTPTFPVLEAVAISMHIPVVWTPVYVSYQHNGIDYTGFYVDGGLYNNFPIRIFNDPTTSVGDMHLFRRNLERGDQTSIGFVLDPRGDYLAPTFPSGLGVPAAAGMTVLDKSTFDQYDGKNEQSYVHTIDSSGLSMMDFAPQQSVIDQTMRNNNTGVYEFLKQYLPVGRQTF